MPIRGRKQQTIDAMKRMITVAGYPANYIAVSGIEDVETTLEVSTQTGAKPLVSSSPKLTYWQALNEATKTLRDDALVVNVANDVLPCSNWLNRAMQTYQAHGDKLVGFNGDGYIDHACHFMISMRYLRELGGYPIWYYHNFGDTELCTRAREQNKFIKSEYAILFHNHPIVSGAQSDTTYDEGSSTFAADQVMFNRRRSAQWTF